MLVSHSFTLVEELHSKHAADVKFPTTWAMVKHDFHDHNGLQILYKSDVWEDADNVFKRLFPAEPANDKYRGSHRVVQVAQLRALAPTQGRPALVSVAVSHTNESRKSCPRGNSGKNFKKKCLQLCLDNLFNVMTLAHSQGPGSVWVLGGDFNLSHELMKQALQDYDPPEGWYDGSVMALGEKDNHVDGLWLISSNHMAPIETDGRKGFDNQHEIFVSGVSVGQSVGQSIGEQARRHEKRAQIRKQTNNFISKRIFLHLMVFPRRASK